MKALVIAILSILSVYCQTNSPVEKSDRAPLERSSNLPIHEFALVVRGDSEFVPQIPDVPVFDQDGRALHFYTDLIKGKVVAIEFVFTQCTTICPPLGATFAKLQRSFGSEMGKTVFLISVSVDPANDTPERLRAWGKQFGAGPGWTLVTGEPNELRRLRQSFGADTASPQEHSPIVVIGNEKRSVWKKVYGLGSASTLIKTIQDVRM
jgi:protein SCO1/2